METPRSLSGLDGEVQVVPNQVALKLADVSGVFCEDCLSPNFAKQNRRVPQQPETPASLRAGGAA